MKVARPLHLLLLALAVGSIALTVRLRAVDMLPHDYDEPVYLGMAQRYAAWLNDGDIRAIVDYEFNYEHPPLSKLAYALAIRDLPSRSGVARNRLDQIQGSRAEERDMPQPQFDISRQVAAVLGALQVFALALLDPLAALLLAISTWQIKYTSQIMLEPLPGLLSTIMVVAYIGWQRLDRLRSGSKRWLTVALLALSAIAFGLTEASKFTYGVAGIAILVDWLWRSRPEKPAGTTARLRSAARWLLPTLLWILLAVIVFVAFDPRTWSDPLSRLKAAVLYHGAYTQSQNVQSANYPMWQPFVWLFQAVPWHPGVFYVSLDFGITLLAALGFRSLWRRQRVMALWLAIGLGFWLVWPTKSPHVHPDDHGAVDCRCRRRPARRGLAATDSTGAQC